MKKLLAGLGLIALAALLSLVYPACATPYQAARATCNVVQSATDIAGGEVANCDPSKPGCVRAQRAWPMVYASVVGSLQAARAAIDVAEQAKSDEAPDYLGYIKRAVCALSRAVGGILEAAIPDKGRGVLMVLGLAGAATCK